MEDAIAGSIALGAALMESFEEGVEKSEILESPDILLGDGGLISRSGSERVSSGRTDIRLGLWLWSETRTLGPSESFENVSVDLWPSFRGIVASPSLIGFGPVGGFADSL
jgi:hypothetical protein